MTARILRTGGLIALALATLPAAAPAAHPGRDDVSALRAFSQCMADRHPTQAAELINQDYRTSDYHKSMQALVDRDTDCAAVGRLRSAGVLFAGNLAEALLPLELRGTRLADAVAFNASRPPLAARDEGEYLGLCTVRTAPAEVAALLDSRPGTAKEDAALQALAPRLAPCVKAGAKAKFNAPGLRAVLALGAYRLVQQNKMAAVAADGN